MEDIKYWVALNRVPQLGTVRFRRLEAHFGKLAGAWQASLAELKAAGIEDRPAREIVAARSRISPDAEIERMSLAGVKPLNWHHHDYPPRLKEIHDPPPVLYYKGTILPDDERAVAVVGTRGPTTYGREAAAALTTDLARNGITIVSGLARALTASPTGRPWTPAAGLSPSWPAGWTRSTHGSTLVCSSGPRGLGRWFASTLWVCGRIPAAFPGGTG